MMAQKITLNMKIINNLLYNHNYYPLIYYKCTTTATTTTTTAATSKWNKNLSTKHCNEICRLSPWTFVVVTNIWCYGFTAVAINSFWLFIFLLYSLPFYFSSKFERKNKFFQFNHWIFVFWIESLEPA